MFLLDKLLDTNGNDTFFAIRTIIGGLHLRHTSEERLERTASYLASLDLERLVLMHCTGENAVDYLRSRLACEVATLPVGRSVTL